MLGQRIRWVTLLGLEALAAGFAFAAGAHLASHGFARGPQLYAAALATALVLALSLSASGLYEPRHLSQPRRLLGALALLSAGGALIALAAASLGGRAVLGGLFAAALCTIGLRQLSPWLAHVLALQPRVFLVGDGRPARHVAREINRAGVGDVVGFAGMRTPELHQRLHETSAQILVVATDDHRGAATAELLQCRTAGVDVQLAASFFERHLGKVAIDYVRPSDLIFGGGFRRAPVADLLRSVISFAVSAVVLLVLAPLLFVAGFVVWMLGGSPTVARELRVGQDEQTYALCVPSTTWGGRVLTRLGLRWLPALWNVLCGEMWIVGPRPLLPDTAARLSRRAPFFELRHRVRPGLWSWAGLHQPASSDDLADAVAEFHYDLFYVRHRSLRLDLRIAWRALGRFFGSP